MIKISEKKISEMILLADDVLKNLLHSYAYYDENGNDIFETYTTINEDGRPNYDQAEKLIREQRNTDNNYLLMRLIHDKKYSLNDVLYMSANDILTILEPIIHRAACIFRKGTIQDTCHNDTNYYVDQNVSDEYIMNLFAMRVRDLMIVNAAQRGRKNFYLLTYTCNGCHDGDEWIAVTDNISELRQYFEAELSSPLKDEYYHGLDLTIYEFNSYRKYKRLTPKEIWGITYE